MQRMIFVIVLLISLSSWADLSDIQTLIKLDIVTEIDNGHVSPFCSSVQRKSLERATLPNMHEVLSETPNRSRVLRSNSPYRSLHVEEVIEQGVEHIIVFKSFSKVSAQKELQKLYRDNGYQGELTFLPVEWRANKQGFYDEVKACRYTMQALQLVRTSQVPVLVHCTVGEDRTGLLSGLMKIAYEGWSVQKTFQEEMCQKGYEAGNPRKSESPYVVNAIRDSLTPLFLKMSVLIEQGDLLEEDCENLPEINDPRIPVGNYQCEPVEDPTKICSQE